MRAKQHKCDKVGILGVKNRELFLPTKRLPNLYYFKTNGRYLYSAKEKPAADNLET